MHKWLNIMALALLLACTREEGDLREWFPTTREEVPVSLAFALQGPADATRADVTLYTELNNEMRFRGMTDVVIIPFDRQGSVLAADEAIGMPRTMPGIAADGLISGNRAHLYGDGSLACPEGTASVLVYGKAPRETQTNPYEDKHKNGSVIASGFDPTANPVASDIAFSPDPIFDGTIPDDGTQISNFLNAIAQAATFTQPYKYTIGETTYDFSASVTWNEDIGDPSLKALFRWFTSDGQRMSGAGHNIEYMLTELNRRLKNFQSEETDPYTHMAGGLEYPTVFEKDDVWAPLTWGDLYDGLAQMLLSRITGLVDQQHIVESSTGDIRFTKASHRVYPQDLGLPEGAAILRWNGLYFIPVSEGLEGIAPMNHFCYMPPLYYFVNSTLKTTQDPSYRQKYSSEYTWSQIVDSYRLGSVINRQTRSAVVESPLQYGVALLSMTVQATLPLLPDNDGESRTNCEASGTNFPVTGIVIGSQFRQHFDFTPDNSGTEYYLYDDQVSGVYLTTEQSADFRTLVLPVPADTDVYFFLELRNDSGSTFMGAEGVIQPGSRFYLAGKLDKADATNLSTVDPTVESVFQADHLTTVHCTVSSMENAHVDVHELSTPQLILGVQTRLNWQMSASAYVVLD